MPCPPSPGPSDARPSPDSLPFILERPAQKVRSPSFGTRGVHFVRSPGCAGQVVQVVHVVDGAMVQAFGETEFIRHWNFPWAEALYALSLYALPLFFIYIVYWNSFSLYK